MTAHHGQFTAADTRTVLDLLGRPDISDECAIAFRYASETAFRAHAAAEARFGNTTLGPVRGDDGGLYGAVLLAHPATASERRCPCSQP